MVSYPLNFPSDLCLNQIRVIPMNAVARSMSKFSFVEQIYNFRGEAWGIEGTLPLLKRDDAEAFVSFAMKLKGRYGTFLFQLPETIASPRGSWGGTPVVDGAGQTGNELDIKGLTPNVNNIIRQGDYINLGTAGNTKLHKILDNANSDSSGETTVTIWPSLRISPGDGDTVVYQNVKVHLRLDGDIPFDVDVRKRYLLSFKAMEALDGS